MDYQYPISYEWSTEEMVDVINFYNAVEKAYETGVEREQLLALYRRFKEIVPSKMEEKQLDAQFQEVSGYSTYRAVKAARESDHVKIKL